MNYQECKICNRIYFENQDRLNWYLIKRFPDLNPEDMRDILQETWHKLSKNIDEVAERKPDEQTFWLMKVSHNEVISLLRKQKLDKNKMAEFQERLMESKQKVSVEDEVVDKITAQEMLQKLTTEEIRILLDKMENSSDKKARKSNAENCKTYRIIQRLRKKLK